MNEVPQFLKTQLYAEYGDVAETILRGYGCERRATLRVNTLKTTRAAVCAFLDGEKLAYESVPWYNDALILNSGSERELQATSLYQRGEIYLQSLSSMLPPLVLEPKAGENILDMTAAPGGKTTQISALSAGQALVTACERDKIRFGRLQYNVRKQGAPRVTLMQTDAGKLDEFFRFDKILLDAPCSGSGILDLRSPVKISEKLVSACMKMQETLLTKALTLLKSGGELVYSTCSVLRCENEGMLERVLPKFAADLIPVCISGGELPRLPGKEGTLCLYPDELYEGFFVAKIKKR